MRGSVPHCTYLPYEERLQIELKELRQQLAEWNEKAKNWIASPESEKQLDGYRAMGAKCAELEAERNNAWEELRGIREAISANPEESTLDEVIKLRQQVTLLRDALDDLASCMKGVIEGDYTPDSFTLQPANMALAAIKEN